MPEVFVEKVSNFADGDRRIVFHDGLEIGVFHWQRRFYAYQNLCLHQGGPCCEGVIMHKVEDVLASRPDLDRAEILRPGSALRVSLARIRIRHHDRRMRRQPQAAFEIIRGRATGRGPVRRYRVKRPGTALMVGARYRHQAGVLPGAGMARINRATCSGSSSWTKC